MARGLQLRFTLTCCWTSGETRPAVASPHHRAPPPALPETRPPYQGDQAEFCLLPTVGVFPCQPAVFQTSQSQHCGGQRAPGTTPSYSYTAPLSVLLVHSVQSAAPGALHAPPPRPPRLGIYVSNKQVWITSVQVRCGMCSHPH